MKLLKLVCGLTLFVAFSACSKKDEDTQLSAAKEITTFNIDTAKGVIDAGKHTITLKMAGTTDVTKLTPAIVISDKATITPATGATQDFTKPVVYTVKAENGTTQAYTVTVVAVKSSSTEILSFQMTPSGNVLYDGVVDTTKGLIKVGMSEDVISTLQVVKPVITLAAGATITPASGEAVDLSKPVTYKVTAEDGTVKSYTVKALSNDTYFEFEVDFGGGSGLAPHHGFVSDMATENYYAEDVAGYSGYIGVFEALVTEDLSNRTLMVDLPAGATISPDPAIPQNFNKDVKYTFTNEFGDSYNFVIHVVRKGQFFVEGGLLMNTGTVFTGTEGIITYLAEAPIVNAWLVSQKNGTEYPLTIKNTIIRGYYDTTVGIDTNTPEGDYWYKVQMQDGSMETSKFRLTYTSPQ